MTNRHSTTRIVAACSWALALACGEPGSSGETPLDAVSQPIIGGTVLSNSEVTDRGLVAVYHFEPALGGWSPRPCSGKIIYSGAGGPISLVLTARHCVTTNGLIDGPLLAPNQISVAADDNPGPATLDGPPPGTLASVVRGSPLDPAHPFWHQDLAIVRVPVHWPTRVAKRDAIYVGDPALLVGLEFEAYGYGVTAKPDECQDDPLIATGAGIARKRGPLTVAQGRRLTVNVASFNYVNMLNGNYVVACGDSGGPDIRTFGSTWVTLLGVHSVGFDNMYSTAVNAWFFNEINGLYVSPLSSVNKNLSVAPNKDVVVLDAPSGSVFQYLQLKRQIRLPNSGNCIGVGPRADGSLGPIQEPCANKDGQVWRMTYDQRLQNLALDYMCLTIVGNQLQFAACSDENRSTQRWAWHPQP